MSEKQPYILIQLDQTTYAIPAHQVAYVDMVEHITPVPHAPDFVEGVVYSRGHVLPVVNLRVRFGLPRVPLSLQNRLIVTQLGERRVGLLVDAAREFANLDPQQIMLPPETVVTPGSAFLTGVTLLDDQRLAFVLDLERILSAEETHEVEAVAAQHEPKE